MQDQSERIVRNDKIEVDARIYDFGFTREDIGKICEGVLYGRGLSTGLQPKTAEGQLKYIFGVESLRVTALASEIIHYEAFSRSNIEGVLDAKNGRKIMFQMVDQACGIVDPQPKSKIGLGKQRFIADSRSPRLFPEMNDDDRKREAADIALDDAECWYVMVSIGVNSVLCCELSQPKTVTNQRFDGFYERIKIFGYGDFEPSFGNQKDDSDDNNYFEIKPQISKR